MAKGKKKKAKVRKKAKVNNSELSLLNIKTSTRDRKRLIINARKYAGGNLSLWLRHAGTKYVPRKSDVLA